MALPQTEPIYTVEEYLAFERDADERHEYLDGFIYAMAGENPTHGTISTNLVTTIVTQLKGKDCRAFTKDMKVRSGPLPQNRLNTKGLFSYPDLVVVCGDMKFLDEYRDVLINPTVIFEVLSESTESFDRVGKFQRYQQYLATLGDYVLVSQSQPLVELYHRHSPELWHYTPASDLKSSIHIPSINCRLRLADIYDRITFHAGNEKSKPKHLKPVVTRKAPKSNARGATASTKKGR